jgi:glycerol-3-phosphate cytidylyltransferase
VTTVFVTGIFDLLHVEHVRFLAAAKNQGHRLIVGIESDVRVRKLKGSARPICSQSERQEMLEALSVVDEVLILPEQFDTDRDYERILQEVKPDVYAVSGNSPYLENKRKICKQCGVELRIVHPYNPEFSTTKLTEKIYKMENEQQ